MPAERPITVGDLVDLVERGRRAQAAVDQILYHGPGPTFGELAIGECFDWPAPIPRPLSGEPLIKASEVKYEWSRGVGVAEDFYRVERWVAP